MTADEIMHALRQAAMGRIGTPEQQRLCEALALVLESPQERALREMSANDAAPHSDAVMKAAAELKADIESTYPEVAAPKRTRKAKAD